MTKNEIQIDNAVRVSFVAPIHLNGRILFHYRTQYETQKKLDVYCIQDNFVTNKLTPLFAERPILNRK